MSDQNAPDQAAGGAENPETAPTPEKKTRSPVERAIVWGGILILLGVVGWEYRAKTACESNFKKLDEKFEAVMKEEKSLVEEDIKKLVTGSPVVDTVEENKIVRVDSFTYSGILKAHNFYVKYGVQGADDGPRDVIQVMRVLDPGLNE